MDEQPSEPPTNEVSVDSPESAVADHGPELQSSESGAEAAAASPPGWRPADYYAAPQTRSKLPRWIPLTCGVVAILAIGLLAATGAILKAGGLAKLVAFAFGQLNGEAEQMFDDGVPPDARAAFKKSLLAVRDGVYDGTIELQSALPLLQTIQKATGDQRLSVDEVEDLTRTFDESLARPAAADPNEPPTVEF